MMYFRTITSSTGRCTHIRQKYYGTSRHLSNHAVSNQSKPMIDYNAYTSDKALMKCVDLFIPNRESTEKLMEVGEYCGSSKTLRHADLAEKNVPVLKQFDSYGNRIDVIEFHPSYHHLMSNSIGRGGAAYGFNGETHGKEGSHVARAAIIYMLNQLESGHCCPIVMTAAAIPILKKLPKQFEFITQGLLSQKYDERDMPMKNKDGLTCGMSMTEKQGGSDVRANTTIATPLSASNTTIGSEYRLNGHKWFTSAPMSDFFLTLAKSPGNSSPSCFLVPRWQLDGTRNTGFKVMRLKNKVADRSNASSEVEYQDATGYLISEEGKGVKTIIEMVMCTRLDCALGSAGNSRKALQLAINHTTTRSAFGKSLITQPLMLNVLADLCLEAEAHTLTAMRMAQAFDRSESNASNVEESELFRIGVSVSKYYITKRQPNFTYECMEAHGGNGFVEDFPIGKLYRHSPLNSIWEGSGNVVALDVVLRGSQSIPMLMKEIKTAMSVNKAFDSYVAETEKLLIYMSTVDDFSKQRMARMIVDRLALALQASLMIRFGSSAVAAETFINTRMNKDTASSVGHSYGSYSVDKTIAEDLINYNSVEFVC